MTDDLAKGLSSRESIGASRRRPVLTASEYVDVLSGTFRGGPVEGDETSFSGLIFNRQRMEYEIWFNGGLKAVLTAAAVDLGGPQTWQHWLASLLQPYDYIEED